MLVVSRIVSTEKAWLAPNALPSLLFQNLSSKIQDLAIVTDIAQKVSYIQPGAVKLVLWRHWMHVTQVHPVTAENQLHYTRLYMQTDWQSNSLLLFSPTKIEELTAGSNEKKKHSTAPLGFEPGSSECWSDTLTTALRSHGRSCVRNLAFHQAVSFFPLRDTHVFSHIESGDTRHDLNSNCESVRTNTHSGFLF